MKRMLGFALTLMLVFSVAAPVAAAANTTDDQNKPFVVSSTSKDGECAFLDEVDKLTEDQIAALTEAQKEELKAAAKDMDVRDLFYFSTSKPTTVVFQVPDIRGASVKQFVDGKWVDLKTTINDDGTITVENAVSAPMMIFTAPKAPKLSPTAPEESATTTALLPVLVSSTSEDCALFTVKQGYKLSAEARKAFEDAQDELKKAVPTGMAARYFFYLYSSKPCTVVFRIQNVTEVVVKQYIDGARVVRESTLNKDGTVSVKDVEEGPIAIFTK